MAPQVIYLLLIIAAVFLLGTLTVLAWSARHRGTGRSYAAATASAALWAVLVGAMCASEPDVARFWLGMKYLAIGGTTVATFLLVCAHTGRRWLLAPLRIGALCVIPVLGHVLSFHDGVMLRSASFGHADNMTWLSDISFGPFYWIFAGYLYCLTLASVVLLAVGMVRGSRMAHSQGLLLMGAILAPVAGSVLLITGIAPRRYDPMPLALASCGLLLFWGSARYRMLDLVPVARNALVDALDEAMLIVDDEGRVLDMNDAWAALAGVERGAWVGQLSASCAGGPVELHALLADALAQGAARASWRDTRQLRDRTVEVRVLRVEGRRVGRPGGQLVVLQDVTERQRWEREQVRLVGELQAALAQVRTLTGLLPVCSSCKQIRDEGGHWQPMETYIRQRTDAEFSHGLCPDCVSALYPELDLRPVP